MALLDIRQRTGWLFGAIVVSHIILISAQVTTKRGVPVLQEVTFGAFAEMQRGATSAFGSAREGWQNYFALQEIRRENDQLKQEVTKLRVSLEQERSVAQQTRTLQQLLDLRSATSFETAAAMVIVLFTTPALKVKPSDVESSTFESPSSKKASAVVP